MKFIHFFRLAIICTAASLALAKAGPIPVAILSGAIGGAAWNQDVKSKLMMTGLFSSIDIFPIQIVTPSLGRLLSYRAVLVFTDGRLDSLDHGNALGNKLADYVDAGGGVVMAVFADASLPVGGRFRTEDYWVIEPIIDVQGEDKQLILGAIHEPGSPLLRGVDSFNAGVSSFHGLGPLNASAIDVADYSDGTPLIARRVIHGVNRVDLNFYPVSNAVNIDFWLQNTDGAAIMANALVFSATPAQ